MTFAAMSLRQQVLNAAASSWLKGGTSRVLTAPATDALAMIATAHDELAVCEASRDADTLSPGLTGTAGPVTTVPAPRLVRAASRLNKHRINRRESQS